MHEALEYMTKADRMVPGKYRARLNQIRGKAKAAGSGGRASSAPKSRPNAPTMIKKVRKPAVKPPMSGLRRPGT